MMSISMEGVEEFKENQRMIFGMKNDIEDLKAILSMKERDLEASRQKMINAIFGKIISVKIVVEEKTAKIKKLEDDALAKNAGHSRIYKQLTRTPFPPRYSRTKQIHDIYSGCSSSELLYILND